MMNVLELQDKLKNFSEDQLVNEMQQPSGSVPQYLVLSEINRRKRIRDDYQQQQQGQQSNMTVAQEKLAAAGVPGEGLAGLAESMAPQTDMTMNTGATPDQTMPMPEAPAPMAEAQPEMGGGIAAMSKGGYVRRLQVGGPPGTAVSLFGINYTLMPDGSIIDFTGKTLDPNNASIAPLIERLKEEANRSNGVAVNAAATPISDVVEGGKGEGILNLTGPSGGGIDLTSNAAATPVADALEQGIVPLGQGQVSGSVPDQNVTTEPPAPGLSPSIESEIADLGISPELWATLSPDEQQNILNFEDPTQGMRDRWAEVTPPYQPPTGRGFFIETFAPAQAARLREATARRNSEERAVAAEAAAAEEAARAAEAARMMEINELPDSPRRVTDAGEIIQPPASQNENQQQPPRSGGGVGGGVGSGGGAGSVDSQIIEMLKEREKRAENDKWLALAQAGMALMSSTQPTLGGALGEAGAEGLKAFRASRDEYEGAKLDLLKMQQAISKARASAASSRDYNTPTAIGAAIDRFTKMQEGLLGKRTEVVTDPLTGEQSYQTVYQTYDDLSPEAQRLYDSYSANIARLSQQYGQFFPADMTQ